MSEKNKDGRIDARLADFKRSTQDALAEEFQPSEPHLEQRVTRDDGSQVIKRKTRKRRSSQPQREREKRATKRRVILLSIAVCLLIMAGLACLGILSYYSGNRYNNKILGSLETASGAKVKLVQLDISPTSAKILGLGFDWSAYQSVVATAEFSGLNANYPIAAFFTGNWEGQDSELTADQGIIQLNLLENPEPNLTHRKPSEIFNFSRYVCSNLDIIIGQQGSWKVSNAQGTFSPADESIQIYLYGGMFTADTLGSSLIQSSVIDIKPSFADISLVLDLEKQNATMSFAGKIPYKKGEECMLSTTLSGMPLSYWIGSRAQRFIKGTIAKGKGSLAFQLGDFASRKTLTKIECDNSAIANFPFIQIIESKIANNLYNKPVYTGRLTCKVQSLKEQIVFSEIDFVKSTRLRITGNLEIRDSGSIQGVLKLGIPIGRLSFEEMKNFSTVFQETSKDCIWAEINIGGTVQNPTDDLAAQFKLARER